MEGAALLAPVVPVVLTDQTIKLFLRSALADGRTVGSVVRLRLVRGRTIAGALGVPTVAAAVVWLAILVMMVVLAPRVPLLDGPVALAGLGVAMGGAASNLLDGPLHGGVVDYLDLRIWPTFNLADAAIVAGAMLAVLA